jgi:hypothetical protein
MVDCAIDDARAPQLLARLMLAEMVREHQGTVRGI